MDLSIEVGTIIESEIIDMSYDGKSVLKKDNFTIFGNKGVVGDIVKLEVVQMKKNFGIGQVLEIIEPSKHRIKSKCEYSQVCGGCQFQEISYEQELKIKKEKVKNDLERIGKVENFEIFDTIGMEEPYRYRNNIQMPVMKSVGKAVIGYFEKNSHRIVNIDKCIIGEEVAEKVMNKMREFIEKEDISCYNRKNNKGLLRHIIVRTTQDAKDTMVTLVINGKEIPEVEKLIESLTQIKEIKSIYINTNKERTNIITGKEFKLIYGQEKIIDKIGSMKYEISPESFFQVNTKQAEKLYEKVAEFADLQNEEVVVDLYSGIGTIGLYLANKAKEVVGVEIVKKAVEDARENAKLNNIENAKFFEGTSEKMLPVLEQVGIVPDVLVLDPPRKGCDEELLKDIVKYEPNKIIYVSCNSATLARDINYLEENGYKTKKVQPVDMFPKTSHVETVVLIQREIM